MTTRDHCREVTLVEDAGTISSDDIEFDLVVVGSGNGACGFLAECQKYAHLDYRILMLEQGRSFFFTFDVTHQKNRCHIYSRGKVFELHSTRTSDGRPIIYGRANTMGGGGTIKIIYDDSFISRPNAWQEAFANISVVPSLISISYSTALNRLQPKHHRRYFKRIFLV